MSFKELCGYGMPISTMFTNGILKADESGTTMIQAPDNAMYNGTSFKTLVAFGLVTEQTTPRIILAGRWYESSEDKDGIVTRYQRDTSKDGTSGDESFPLAWKSLDDVEGASEVIFSNVERPVVGFDEETSESLMHGIPSFGVFRGNGKHKELNIEVYGANSITESEADEIMDFSYLTAPNLTSSVFTQISTGDPSLEDYVEGNNTLRGSTILSCWAQAIDTSSPSVIDSGTFLVLCKKGESFILYYAEF